MTGFFLAGWTVAFWDHAYVFFLFLMGSGVWMLDVRPKERAALEGQVFEPAGSAYVLVDRPFPINSRRDEQCRGHGRLPWITTPPPTVSRIQDRVLVPGTVSQANSIVILTSAEIALWLIF